VRCFLLAHLRQGRLLLLQVCIHSLRWLCGSYTSEHRNGAGTRRRRPFCHDCSEHETETLRPCRDACTSASNSTAEDGFPTSRQRKFKEGTSVIRFASSDRQVFSFLHHHRCYAAARIPAYVGLRTQLVGYRFLHQ